MKRSTKPELPMTRRRRNSDLGMASCRLFTAKCYRPIRITLSTSIG